MLIKQIRKHYIFLIIPCLMLFILLDTSIINIYDLVNKTFVSIEFKKYFFAITSITCLILEIVIINHIRKLFVTNQLINKDKFKIINTCVLISQYLLIFLVSLIIFKQFYFNYYDSLLLMFVVIISYGVPSFLLLQAAALFLRWYRINKKIVPLLYFVSLIMLVFNFIIINTIVNISIDLRPDQVREFVGGSMNIVTGKYEVLNFHYGLSTILSFVSIWFTTTILLYSSESKISTQVRHLVLLVLPLFYFLLGYFGQNTIYKFLFSLDFANPIYISIFLTLIFSLSKPVGGIIFGIVFWNAAKLFPYNKLIKEYLIYTGIGFLFLFSANQSTVLAFTPYPPFGIAAITILIVSSYLILIGISTSASLIAKNVKLRQTIYQVTKESNLLNYIGSAEIEIEMKETMKKIIKKTESIQQDKEEQIDENQLRQYIVDVLRELKKK
jgi:hypothetical protein